MGGTGSSRRCGLVLSLLSLCLAGVSGTFGCPYSSSSTKGSTHKREVELRTRSRTEMSQGGPTAAGNAGPSKNKLAMGVLQTGYLDKTNPNKTYDKVKKRFVVLTHVGFHWFKRENGYDLFGEERGSMAVQDITKVDMYYEGGVAQPDMFEVVTKDQDRRVFRAASDKEASVWVNAINTAIRNRAVYRRETLNGLSFLTMHTDDAPLVSLVSLKKADTKTELVLSKGPLPYGVDFKLPVHAQDDVLSFTMSNGACAETTVKTLMNRNVGDVVNVRVNTNAHTADLLVSVDGKEVKGEQKTPVQALMDGGADVYVLAAFGALLAGWVAVEPMLTKERFALVLLLCLAAVRPVMAAQKVAKQPPMAVLKLTIEDYCVEKKADAASALPPIPQRFIDGCFGDMVEAERRWRITVQWRQEFQADKILEMEHPYYDDIKQALPHYYCLTGYDGNPVYIERSGQTDLPKAKTIGLDWLVWHYVWATEFLYTKIHPREDAKTITIFDVAGVGLKDATGEPFEFIRAASHIMQEHYPERCRVIIIANTPGWFSFIWKLIRPMVNEVTQKKIRIVKAGDETFKAMSEFIDPKNIPVEYGGQLKYGDETDSCRWNSPEEKMMREHVKAVNTKAREARKAKGISEPARFVAPNHVAK